MARLLLVSNRLPVTVKVDRGSVQVNRSSGGLATGLSGPHERSGGLWLGWPGDISRVPESKRAQVDEQLRALRCVPLHLTQSEVSRFYEGFSNGILWPVFHYLVDRIPQVTRDWDVYWKANQKFADLVAVHYQKGDTIWVHDYQLMLVPGMLRKRLPDARIGFFLHIPFPSWEIFRILPWREQLLEGLLGADLIGFHTHNYLRHFATSLLRMTGVELDVDRVRYQGREVRLAARGMGIDADSFASLANDPSVQEEARQIRRQHGDGAILLGIDRLDYTKGIPRRLLAMERLLEREPQLRGHIKLIQLSVPSREKVPAYESFRRQVEELVGRINGTYATATWMPIHYLYRSLTPRQVCALYMAADVMLVTPLRDGMNLVAKEFVATRVHDDGVLVLSEFAGAASEMGEALLVNAYDIDGTARGMHRALAMSADERRHRMAALRQRVMRNNVHAWAQGFVDLLERTNTRPPVSLLSPDDEETLLRQAREAPSLQLILDYDGTLVPFTAWPELAIPDDDLLEALSLLCRAPRTDVAIISGRDKDTLHQWLGDLPVQLFAENGYWSRDVGGAWQCTHGDASDAWKDRMRAILDEFTERTPGAFVEEKTMSLAWHFRHADSEFGLHQAQELRLHLGQLLRDAEVEVLPGARVVEVRRHGVRKSAVVAAVCNPEPAVFTIAVGDDRSDEEMYAALPPGSVSLHAGSPPTRANHRVAGPAAVRTLLRAIAAERLQLAAQRVG